MHQEGPIGRDRLDDPGGGCLAQDRVEGQNPAVEFGVDRVAELHRDGGVPAGKDSWSVHDGPVSSGEDPAPGGGAPDYASLAGHVQACGPAPGTRAVLPHPMRETRLPGRVRRPICMVGDA